MSRLHNIFPFLGWRRLHDRKSLRSDVAAGLTTAVMLVPQAMGYAMLAGLPPSVGLYASLVPLGIYALLGTSRQLAVGPVAMVSLLVAAGVGTIAEPNTESFVAYAVLLSLMVGAMQLVMGLARLGALVRLLSHPVIAGFTSAAALIIGLSQLKHLLGVNIARSHHVHELLLNAWAQIGDVHALTTVLGVAAIGALLALKTYRPRVPRALLVVAASTLLVWSFGLHEQGVAIVGTVPAGLPPLSLPSMDLTAMRSMLPMALAIALVGFMESISVAKAFAAKHGYEVDANQELVALGAANLGGSVFGAYPVTGGFSRTAVNDEAGARSGVASLVTASLVALTLVLLTPLFHYLPQVVLAAIIMTAVFGLVDVKEAKHLWRVDRSDLALMGITFAATLSLGIEQGIGVGVTASLAALMFRTSRPHVAVLGRLPDGSYRNVDRHVDAKQTAGVLAVRLDAQLYFANVDYLKDTLDDLEGTMSEPLRAVVLDATAINRVDSSAATELQRIDDAYRQRNVALYIAGAKGPVLDMLQRAHVIDHLGDGRFVPGVHQAFAAVAR